MLCDHTSEAVGNEFTTTTALRCDNVRYGFPEKTLSEWDRPETWSARLSIAARVYLERFVGQRTDNGGQYHGEYHGQGDLSAGAVLPHASVTAINTQTGIKETITTNDSGRLFISDLADRTIRRRDSHPGFKTFRQTGLVLDVNSSLRVDTALEVGSVADQVNVLANPVQVETSNTQLGEVIGSTKIESVPLNGRSYTDLLPTTRGRADQLGNLHLSMLSLRFRRSNPGNLAINGQREDANGFMVNGTPVNEGVTMGTAVIPNLDSYCRVPHPDGQFRRGVREFQRRPNQRDSKSGTNHFHGNAFEFLRNTNLDARSYYDPTVGKFDQNQFGVPLAVLFGTIKSSFRGLPGHSADSRCEFRGDSRPMAGIEWGM